MRWMWIDRVLRYEPERRLVAIKNVSMAEEHLHDHFAADAHGPALPLMPASLIVEGMAQTAGILVGAVHRFREKVILAKVARAELECDVVPGQSLRYDATIDRMDEIGASTHGVVSLSDPGSDATTWTEIGAIDLLFSHLDQNLAGLDFPDENFVFSENFRVILRSAGLGDLADER